MNEKINKINGIDICSESFGDPNDSAVLLIQGAMCSMVYWDEEFCQRLADTGKFVLRYDHRDVGRSTTYEPGKPQYTVMDLAEDAIGVLDSYGIELAHIVGLSLGGMIAQIIALKHPTRVLSITMIASGMIEVKDNLELPQIDERILEYHGNAATLDWEDKEAVAHYLVKGSALLCGSKHAFDEQRAYKQVNTEINRANNLLSMFNHALLQDDDSFDGKIQEITVPALVIHGTEDIVLPYQHAIALANEIPNAKLVSLEGTSHEVHVDDWDIIIDEITDHIENSIN